MHPWLVTLWKSGRRLSDIEYLSIKEFDGKLVKNMGAKLTAVGTLATLTASSGKDMYLARAKIAFRLTSGNIEVELRINGTAVETMVSDIAASNHEYEFHSTGYKVAATEKIELEWITETGIAQLEGFIECFEETTGASPAA